MYTTVLYLLVCNKLKNKLNVHVSTFKIFEDVASKASLIEKAVERYIERAASREREGK